MDENKTSEKSTSQQIHNAVNTSASTASAIKRAGQLRKASAAKAAGTAAKTAKIAGVAVKASNPVGWATLLIDKDNRKMIIRIVAIILAISLLLTMCMAMIPALMFGVFNSGLSAVQNFLSEVWNEAIATHTSTGGRILTLPLTFFKVAFSRVGDAIKGIWANEQETEMLENEETAIDAMMLKITATQNVVQKRADDVCKAARTIDSDAEKVAMCEELSGYNWLWSPPADAVEALGSAAGHSSYSVTVNSPGKFSQGNALRVLAGYATATAQNADNITIEEYIDWLGTDTLLGAGTTPWSGTMVPATIYEEYMQRIALIKANNNLSASEKEQQMDEIRAQYIDYETGLVNYFVVCEKPSVTATNHTQTWIEYVTEVVCPAYEQFVGLDENGLPRFVHVPEETIEIQIPHSYTYATGVITYNVRYLSTDELGDILGLWADGLGSTADMKGETNTLHSTDTYSSVITSGENDEIIWSFLKSKGLNDYAVAGIMGNLYAESGLEPTNLQGSYESSLGYSDASYTAAVDDGSYRSFASDSAGYGLAQWTYSSRKQKLLDYAKSTNRSIGDILMQLEFLWMELEEGYSSVLARLNSATSLLEASNAFMLGFERPADQSTSAQNRRAGYGQKYYDKADTYKELQNSVSADGTAGCYFDCLPAEEPYEDYQILVAPDPGYVSYAVKVSAEEESWIKTTITNEYGGCLAGAIATAQTLRDMLLYFSGLPNYKSMDTMYAILTAPNVWNPAYVTGPQTTCENAEIAFDYVFNKGGCFYPRKFLGQNGYGDEYYSTYNIIKKHTHYGCGTSGFVYVSSISNDTDYWYGYNQGNHDLDSDGQYGSYINPNYEVTPVALGTSLESAIGNVEDYEGTWTVSVKSLGQDGTTGYYSENKESNVPITVKNNIGLFVAGAAYTAVDEELIDASFVDDNIEKLLCQNDYSAGIDLLTALGEALVSTESPEESVPTEQDELQENAEQAGEDLPAQPDPMEAAIEYVNRFIAGIGAADTVFSGYEGDTINHNVTTVNECTAVIELAYNGVYVSSLVSGKIINLLTQNSSSSILLSGLTETTKIGALMDMTENSNGTSYMESAIIWTSSNTPYVISISVEDSSNVAAIKDDIATYIKKLDPVMVNCMQYQSSYNTSSTSSGIHFGKNFFTTYNWFFSDKWGFDDTKGETLWAMKNAYSYGRDEENDLLAAYYSDIVDDMTVERTQSFQYDTLNDYIANTAEFCGITLDYSNGTGTTNQSGAGGRRLATIAQTELSNYGGQACGNRYWGSMPSNWCCWFVYWCAEQMGLVGNGQPFGPRVGLVYDAMNQIVENGGTVIWPGEGQPAPGDIVLFWNGGRTGNSSDPVYNTSLEHIGIVTEVNGSTAISVEGNCGGGGYMNSTIKSHEISTEANVYSANAGFWVYAFVRPNYPGGGGAGYDVSSREKIQAALLDIVYQGAPAVVSCDFDGYVSTPGRHEGIDLALSKGTSIYAASSGEVTNVIHSGSSSSLSILCVYDDVSDKTVVYLHDDYDDSIHVGDFITQGDYIGTENSYGASGSHVHIEVVNGRRTGAMKSVNDNNLENEDPYAYWASVLGG